MRESKLNSRCCESLLRMINVLAFVIGMVLGWSGTRYTLATLRSWRCDRQNTAQRVSTKQGDVRRDTSIESGVVRAE